MPPFQQNQVRIYSQGPFQGNNKKPERCRLYVRSSDAECAFIHNDPVLENFTSFNRDLFLFLLWASVERLPPLVCAALRFLLFSSRPFLSTWY